MHSQPITLRTRTPRDPTYTVIGTLPFAGCPLAVTAAHVYDHDPGRWRPHQLGGYYVTHVPTGYQLGGVRFGTVDEAMRVLERCDVAFPAWPLATGAETDPATLACKAKWRAATELG